MKEFPKMTAAERGCSRNVRGPLVLSFYAKKSTHQSTLGLKKKMILTSFRSFWVTLGDPEPRTGFFPDMRFFAEC